MRRTCPNDQAFADNLYSGLTKREWFAGQALGGLSQWADALSPAAKQCVGRLARELADAVIAELNKEPPCDSP